jgi:hypothetical protein
MEPQAQLELSVSPEQLVLQALTVQQVPPASLEFLVRLVQPGSTGLLVRLVSRAVMVLLGLLA